MRHCRDISRAMHAHLGVNASAMSASIEENNGSDFAS